MSSLKLIFGAALFSMSFLNPQEVQGVLNSLKESHITHPDTAGDIPRLLPGAPGSLSERLKPQDKGLRLTLRFLCRLSTKGAIWSAARWYDWLKLACGVWVSISLMQVLWFGISNFQPDLLQKFLAICDASGYVKPSIYQGDYIAINHGMGKKLLPIVRKYEIAYNACRVLASGFLCGKFTHPTDEGTLFSADNPLGGFMRELHDQDVLDTALKRSEEVTEAFGVTTIDAALRWAYYHSALAENDGIILGASSIAQIESKVESIGRGPLPEELLRISNGIWKGLEPSRGDVIRHILIYNWNRPTGLSHVISIADKYALSFDSYLEANYCDQQNQF
ncbi:Aldo/keto reductase [Aspergillus phoenicis ATCC 13157]|uniref:Aldo/keto reductase n=1 Tax=Aspergillus phoenicis ATCC 13157 TaxID=1353007 RepID=A0A370P3U3_ASPPH|nr:Aldo/keto reductase [Aspergillus phoenicis ATCC 13157]